LTQAAQWFRAAADQGFAPAQANLAFLYFKGIGVPIDYSAAAHWARLAAEQGHPHAATNFAYLCENGKGVPLDYFAAYIWYSRAIAAGDKSGADRRKSLSRLLTREQIDEANSLVAANSSQPQQVPSSAAIADFTLLQDH